MRTASVRVYGEAIAVINYEDGPVPKFANAGQPLNLKSREEFAMRTFRPGF